MLMSSFSSEHSLRSHGPVVNPLISAGSQGLMKTRKKVAHWTDGEMAVLLDFLAGELSKAGDGKNFKKTTWMAAASHITLKFPVMKGGPKDTEACECRFQLVSVIPI
ncbi:hypothetical protein J3R83DRAFT_10712 [Lanmaoa asiatica]|nr:hypothetical protein J3R83DRAFT_10712 [Lanmaoa asiatica]